MGCPAGGITRGARPTLELADVLREHLSDPTRLTARQQQAVLAITHCRTAAMGGRVQTCDRCGHHEILYNSCRDRHCPKCQAMAQARWVEARLEDLLPVEYYHIVFTVPQILHGFFHADPARAYGHLFAAVSTTLLEVAAHPDRLAADIGFIAILHTWTQTLQFHPHIHCVVPGGGISLDGDRWVPSKAGFFLPVKVLSTVFRGKLLRRLEREATGPRSSIAAQDARPLLRQAAGKNWMVYAKPPFGGPDRVVKYLGRYTHRIAISNARLVSMEDGHVTFRFQDRRDRNRPKAMSLEAPEFVRRFLQHVVPRGFVRIRYYGFMANRKRQATIPRIRTLIGGEQGPDPARSEAAHARSVVADVAPANPRDSPRCPRCYEGRLIVTEVLPDAPRRWLIPGPSTSP